MQALARDCCGLAPKSFGASLDGSSAEAAPPTLPTAEEPVPCRLTIHGEPLAFCTI